MILQGGTVPITKQVRAAKRPKASDALDHYHRLIALLADRVRSVAGKFQTGAYLVGRAGSGKTHTVRRVLEECGANYVILNGRITPAALYEEIEERADSIVVIDDVPTLFDSQHAAQILLAAIGGDPGTPRRVTYVTKKERRITEFRGGIIAIRTRRVWPWPVAWPPWNTNRPTIC
jgi:hypothetical protein